MDFDKLFELLDQLREPIESGLAGGLVLGERTMEYGGEDTSLRDLMAGLKGAGVEHEMIPLGTDYLLVRRRQEKAWDIYTYWEEHKDAIHSQMKLAARKAYADSMDLGIPVTVGRYNGDIVEVHPDGKEELVKQGEPWIEWPASMATRY